MSILQFAEHFQLIFVNSNVNNDQQIKQKRPNFFCKLFRIIEFFLLSLLREATLESKVAATNRKTSVFLLRTSKTFSNVELFSIFSQTFLGLIFDTKIITMLLKQSAVKNNCVSYVSKHLKYCLQINKYWLNKSACLNIV